MKRFNFIFQSCQIAYSGYDLIQMDTIREWVFQSKGVVNTEILSMGEKEILSENIIYPKEDELSCYYVNSSFGFTWIR